MFRDHNQRSDRTGGRARRQRCHSRRRRSSADGGTTRSRVAPSPVPSPHALTGHEPTACSGVRAPGCRPCAHEPRVTRPCWWWPTYARTGPTPSCFRIPDRHLDRPPLRAGGDQAARGDGADPGPVDRGRARKGPAARQDPTTPFNLMGHIFLNVHERNRDISRCTTYPH
jgi:hypothetical protein